MITLLSYLSFKSIPKEEDDDIYQLLYVFYFLTSTIDGFCIYNIIETLCK